MTADPIRAALERLLEGVEESPRLEHEGQVVSERYWHGGLFGCGCCANAQAITEAIDQAKVALNG